jgi:hypothetical protein
VLDIIVVQFIQNGIFVEQKSGKPIGADYTISSPIRKQLANTCINYLLHFADAIKVLTSVIGSSTPAIQTVLYGNFAVSLILYRFDLTR